MKKDKRKKYTIEINNWSSTCGNCGKGASPSEESHKTIVEYGDDAGKPGCGIKWEYMCSAYTNMKGRLTDQFPQYKFINILFI